VIYNLYR